MRIRFLRFVALYPPLLLPVGQAGIYGAPLPALPPDMLS